MSLIKCNECNGTVSTKASFCPHCGCPLATVSTYCNIMGEQYDLSFVLNIAKSGRSTDNRVKACHKIRELTNLDLVNAIKLWNTIVETQQIPRNFNPSEKQESQQSFVSHAPKCPTCGSTKLIKKGVGARAIDGFIFGRHSIEGRSQWRCESCGYMW